MKMSRIMSDQTFVCLDDLTLSYEPMNYVIYNPNKDDKLTRITLLFDKIKDRFGVELTSKQLTELTRYESHQLEEFVTKLRGIIFPE